MNKKELQKALCQQLCKDIQLIEREGGKMMISTPFSHPDGDNYSLYLKEVSDGKIRISDEADTIMRLSYETPDVNKYFKGNRGQLMKQILREQDIQQDNGNFYVETLTDKISQGIFRLGQALNQIYDLSYLNKDRLISTFHEDLEELLDDIVKEKNLVDEKKSIILEKDYQVPELDNAENYTIDYSLKKDGGIPLFLFGITNQDKAKLVTITLQHLSLHNIKKSTLLIFERQEEIPHKHLGRLMDANVGGSQVSSIVSRESIDLNIENYVH